MPSISELLERESTTVDLEPGDFERLLNRRDRKRRNRRIAAGVIGIGVFVAAVGIVTSVGSLDRSETAIAPGPAETGPPSAPASAAPDVVRTGMCSDGARWRLEVTDTGDWIKVRFEVHQSPVGHEWRIHFRYLERNFYDLIPHHVFFRGTRVVSDSGVFVVQLRHLDWERLRAGLVGEAVDGQTGQVCKVRTLYRD